MILRRLGTLPLAALNIGVAAAPNVLASAAAGVAIDIAGIPLAIAAQAQFKAVPPSVGALSLMATAWLATRSPATLAQMLNPANWVTLGGSAQASLTVQLGLVEAELAIAEGLVAKFAAGLNAGGLLGWTYAGKTPVFGELLTSATKQGRRDLPASTPVQAVILATHDFGAWNGLSRSVHTGNSGDVGAKPANGTLVFQGILGGGDWNTGLAEVFLNLEIELFKLRGMKASLKARIAFMAGLNLPQPQVLLDVSVDIDAALGSLVLGLDLTAQLARLEAKVSALLALSAELKASLNISGGGLTAWSYSGPFGALGSEFATEVANGLPGVNDRRGACYGLVIACASPSAWADFGLIFKT